LTSYLVSRKETKRKIDRKWTAFPPTIQTGTIITITTTAADVKLPRNSHSTGVDEIAVAITDNRMGNLWILLEIWMRLQLLL
jgi:hypothetical protein